MINSIMRLVCKALKKPLPHKLWRYGDLPEWHYISRVLPRDVAVAIKDVVISRVRSDDRVEDMALGLSGVNLYTLFNWFMTERYLRKKKGIDYDFGIHHEELQEKYGEHYDLRHLPPQEQPSLFEEEEEHYADS